MSKKVYQSSEIFGYLGFGIRGEVSDTGSLNNVDIGDSPIVYFTGATPVLSGIVNDNLNSERFLLICYNGSGSLSILNNSSNSLAANRFDLTSNITLNQKEVSLFVYDTESEKWRQASSAGSGTVYSVEDYGSVGSSVTADLSLMDEGSAKFIHTNSSPSVITLSNGVPGKRYRIFGKSNGIQYSWAAASSGIIRWPSSVDPIISANNKADLWIFDCIATNKYIGTYVTNYDSTDLF